MDILMCIILIATAIYEEFVIYKMSVLKKRLLEQKIDNNSIDNIICSEKQKVQEVSFDLGDYYAYDSLKKEIRYLEKEQYSFYDLWGINHEIGHLYDDSNNMILRFTIAKVIERLLFLPIFIVLCILKIRYNLISVVNIEIIGIGVLVLVFVHLYFICKYEKSASEFAYHRLEKIDKITLCKSYALYCIKQQILMEILELQFVFLLFAIVTTK